MRLRWKGRLAGKRCVQKEGQRVRGVSEGGWLKKLMFGLYCYYILYCWFTYDSCVKLSVVFLFLSQGNNENKRDRSRRLIRLDRFD